MNIIVRRFFAFVIAFTLITAPAIQLAQAASGWVITKAATVGARVIVNATKGGYKSAVNIAPNVGRVAKFGMRAANTAGILYAAAQLANDGVDFVLDPANNSVRFTKPGVNHGQAAIGVTFAVQGIAGVNAADACRNYAAYHNNAWGSNTNQHYSFVSVGEYRSANYSSGAGVSYTCKYSSPLGASNISGAQFGVGNVRSIPLSDLAPKIISNAAAGHSDSKDLVLSVAVAGVNAGDFDADLMSGAVPTNDTRPLVPAVPGAQAGDVGAGVTGGDVGAQSDRARAEADAKGKAAQAAKDAATGAAADAQAARDAAKDLINQDVDKAIQDAANAAATAAEAAAAEAAKVADAAAAASAAAAAAAAAATQAAATQAATQAATAEAAAEAARKAGADAATQAAADAAAAAAAATAAAAAQAAAQAAADAAAAAAAKPQPKPFELPAFCSWARPVCDFTAWAMADPQLMPIDDFKPEIADETKFDNIDLNSGVINASGQCPAPEQLSIFGGSVSLSYAPLCMILEKLAPVIVACAYITGAYIIVRNQ